MNILKAFFIDISHHFDFLVLDFRYGSLAADSNWPQTKSATTGVAPSPWFFGFNNELGLHLTRII